MPAISVELFRADNPGPAIPDESIELATMGEESWRAILIEGGMASGQHAVALSIPIGDGKVVVHQTSFLALRAAVRSLESMAETQLGWDGSSPHDATGPYDRLRHVISVRSSDR